MKAGTFAAYLLPLASRRLLPVLVETPNTSIRRADQFLLNWYLVRVDWSFSPKCGHTYVHDYLKRKSKGYGGAI
jgi:hypothetical protein